MALTGSKERTGQWGETITEIDLGYNYWTFPVPDVYGIQEQLKIYVGRGLNHYRLLLEHGVAKEQAQLFLPAFALYHTGICKVDAHNLMHFLRLRTDEHAQWEIRQYALAIEQMFAEVLPWTFELYSKEKENKS